MNKIVRFGHFGDYSCYLNMTVEEAWKLEKAKFPYENDDEWFDSRLKTATVLTFDRHFNCYSFDPED